VTVVGSSSPSAVDESPRVRDAAFARRPALAGELVVVAVLVFCYDRICGLATAHQTVAVRNGEHVLGVEQRLHLDVELTINLWLAAHSHLAWLASWYYQLVHLTVTLLVLLACYWWRPDVYRSARNALVAINALALVVFWTFPVAPPRLLPGSGFVDITQATGAAAGAATSAPDPYAAMPSLHTAWAVWVAIIGWALLRRWWARALVIAYPAVTVTVIVVTGNHYLLDAVAGGLLAAAATVAAGMRRRHGGVQLGLRRGAPRWVNAA
jgi:membrane-associated phospholipid phosphatase